MNRHFSNIFLCLSDQTYERAEQSIIRHAQVYTEVEDTLLFVVKCVFINNRTSTHIKLGTCIVNVLRQL